MLGGCSAPASPRPTVSWLCAPEKAGRHLLPAGVEGRERGGFSGDFYGQTRKWDNHICSRVLRQLPPVAVSTLRGDWKICPQGWSSLVPFHRQALVPLPSAPSALLSCPRGDFLGFAGGACSTWSFQLHSAHPQGLLQAPCSQTAWLC